MVEDPGGGAAGETSTISRSGLPQQSVTQPPPEAGEMHYIRRSQWEALERCVGRVKEEDTFNASLASVFGGASIAALISFITVASASPHAFTLAFLGIITVLAGIMTGVVYYVEKRARENRVSHLDALREEMDAAKHYMVDDGSPPPA